MFVSRRMELQDDWIDYNGHLNMAYYNVLFDRGCDEIFEAFGMGPDYAETRKLTVYTAEIHVRYLRELHLGDAVQCAMQILDHDEKRLHTWSELRHIDGWVAATCETLTLHIDMAGPNVTPFPDDVAEKIEALANDHSGLSRPDGAGRSIAITRRSA